MAARKSVQQPDPSSVRYAYRGWPPTCLQCGWTGIPSQTESPYLACGGNQAMHQRTPVGAR